VKKIKILTVTVICLCAAVMIYGVLIEPYWIEVHHIYVDNVYLNGILKKMIAVDLSDLHINHIGKREQRVLELLNEIKPDFIFLTGDYISWKGDPRVANSFLSQLKATYGVWAVMGDYDYSRSRQSCFFCHQMTNGKLSVKTNVQFLRNTVDSVILPNGILRIGGFDDQGNNSLSKEEETSLFLGPAPDILLSHKPFIFDKWKKTRNILILAGDTHGGQLPLARWMWQVLGYKKNARFNKGWFFDGRKQMYVSRGIGTSHFPIRIMNRPEFIVFHF
jgi:predicted MPP superfamily phosphohydrolase